MLADEPTGSVDAATARYILDVFRTLNKELGLTIVIVTHDRMLSKMVDRVVSIRDGKTSSERVMINGYAHALEGVSSLSDASDLLESIGVQGNRVKMNVENGRIVIEPPKAIEKEEIQ